jgi:D-sedoheptulose 7-phosphate isomerase
MKKSLVPKRPSLRGIFRTPAVPSLLEWPPKMPDTVLEYRSKIDSALRAHDWTNFTILLETLQEAWREGRQVFLCGNGGSAANAIHLANDFLYGIDKPEGRGLRVLALPANASVLTCLANDISYDDVFAQQLTVLAQPGDVLIALSGSGNSPNILKALTRASELRLTSFAILGFSGGQALDLAEYPLYFPVHDMQVAEDLQTMIGHMAMQWLSANGRGQAGRH